uniref:DNA binding protein n=1 Tax=Solanum tuberosum TaxID=4113 RepID=M1CHN8_SOLTU
MKIPPKKPHFFKPIQPGFKNGLKIPIGFLKYLKGNDNVEHAILKRGGYKWPMKVNGHRFEAGWVEFVEQQGLKLGDILMFRHEGNMEFEVSIFDSTHCDRDYVEYMEEGGGGGGGDHTSEEKFKFKDIMKKPSNMSLLNAQVVTSTSGDDHHPSFSSTVKPYCFTRAFLSNGLMNRKCEMVLKDEAQRCWSVWIGRAGRHFGILRGWTKFRAENGLRVGDAYKFELIKNGEMPIAQFHCKCSFSSNVVMYFCQD